MKVHALPLVRLEFLAASAHYRAWIVFLSQIFAGRLYRFLYYTHVQFRHVIFHLVLSISRPTHLEN